MNFFKSVFSDDPDPPSDDDTHTSPEPTSPPTTDAGGWNMALGGIIKTISSKSETVLETYRRDLHEFTSGLKNETDILKHVATSSLDLGAAKASLSLESVGQAFDTFGSAVSDIISHGKDSLLAHDLDSIHSETSSNKDVNVVSMSGAKYSRFEAQLRAIQSDVRTYVEDPEDGEEFGKWKSMFDVADFRDEIEALLGENGSVEGIYVDSVPSVVDHDLFWCRYFYRVHRLKQAEFVRAKLVKRAIEADEEEEELSWDVDDDDVEEEKVKEVSALGKKVDDVALGEEKLGAEEVDAEVGSLEKKDDVVTRDVGEEKKAVVEAAGEKESNEIEQVDEKKAVVEVGGEKKSNETERVEEKKAVVEAGAEKESNEIEPVEEKKAEVKEELVKKVEEKAALEGKREPSESGKDSDLSVVSSQPSHEEEDLGWDEIEDIGSGDEKKMSLLGSPNRAELRKRLSAAEDDEDLSWDIDDDDD